MKTVLVTGSEGFIGKNLVERLKREKDLRLLCYDIGVPEQKLGEYLDAADVVFHLAGVNRPPDPADHEKVNAGLTAAVVDHLLASGRKPLVVLTSSTQAELDNPYGLSKRKAEETLTDFARASGAPVRIFRLPGVFGKWCRPNYNSVVATFCHNIAHGLPITVSDPTKELRLVYVDDVVAAFAALLSDQGRAGQAGIFSVEPEYRATLAGLVEKIRGFKAIRETLHLPDEADRFTRLLHATYLSYLPRDGFAYRLAQKIDQRGELAELLKSEHFGQIFVSRTRPGITRGNHFHDTKIEKFCVIEGEAIIRFRHIREKDILEYPVSGKDFKVVDIPPGYTHSIENTGDTDLIVLFWSNEVFDPLRPDTYVAEVRP
jgi:UDP-2-acetamido-2,6-beta-L-arabino-hexul-4-ose reductase